MIRKIDLFKMLFYALDSIYDKEKETDLGEFLSKANPFLFEGEGSADPAVYDDFCKSVISINDENYGYDEVCAYLSKIENGVFMKYFSSISLSSWLDSFEQYLQNEAQN